jgi:hypothetical protein
MIVEQRSRIERGPGIATGSSLFKLKGTPPCPNVFTNLAVKLPVKPRPTPANVKR